MSYNSSYSQNSNYYSRPRLTNAEKRRASAPVGSKRKSGGGQQTTHGSVAGSSSVEEKENRVLLDGSRLLKKYSETMNRDGHRFVWWRTGGPTYNAGHVIVKETKGERLLIKTILNNYEIRSRSTVANEPPADITTANAENVIAHFQTALTNFETRATVERKEKASVWNGWRASTTREDIVVAKFGFSSYPSNKAKLAVYNVDEELFWISVGKLHCQPNNQDTSGLEQQITELQAQVEDLTTRKQRLEQGKRDLQNEAGTATRELAKVKRQLDTAKKQTQAEKQKHERNTTEARNLRRERDRLEKRLEDQRKQLSASDKRISKLEQDLQDCNQRIVSNEHTIRLWSEKHRAIEQEKFDLEQNLHEKMQVIDELREKEAKLQTMDTLVKATAQQNDELRNQNGKLQRKQGEFLGLLSTTADYWSVNVVNDLISLRRNQHDSAFEEVCEERLGLDEAQSYHLLWRVFMFAYEFCEGRMNEIRKLLRLDQNEELANMFITRLQEAYAKTFDTDGLEKAFLAEYVPQYDESIKDQAMMEYLRCCGNLCWCVVLSSSPKVEFRPRVDDVIDSDKYVAFDSSKFCPFSSLPMSGGEFQVVQYVLPGLYRVDSEVAASNNAGPCVRVKKVKGKARAKPSTPPVGSVRAMTKKVVTTKKVHVVEEASLESELWDGNIEPVKRMLRKQGINLKWKTVVIGCAQCDYEFVQSLDEYEKLVKEGFALECREDDDHEGARVVRIRYR